MSFSFLRPAIYNPRALTDAPKHISPSGGGVLQDLKDCMVSGLLPFNPGTQMSLPHNRQFQAGLNHPQEHLARTCIIWRTRKSTAMLASRASSPLGEESAERYECIPAQVTVIEDVCKKWLARYSENGRQAAAADLPLNRQEKIFADHRGDRVQLFGSLAIELPARVADLLLGDRTAGGR